MAEQPPMAPKAEAKKGLFGGKEETSPNIVADISAMVMFFRASQKL